MSEPRRRFERLVAPHADALWALALRLAGDDASADDLLQQALLTALTRIGDLREEPAARAWSARIVVRTWLDGKRRRTEPTWTEDPAAPGPSPEARAGARELGDRIARAFDALPPDQRAAVWLVDAEEFSFAEAAEALGVAPGTVASRVARGRAALRARLSDLDTRRMG